MTLNDWNITNEWSLFLDRDGVINKRIVDDYVKTPEEFEFLPGALEAIARFTKLFSHIFVVTNQQGIGKKIMTERNLSEIHTYMRKEIEKAGGKLSAIYFAPDIASKHNTLRKPQTGMGLQAKKDFPEIDFSKSIMVGDSESDILFGTNLGMKTIKIGNFSPLAMRYASSLLEIANQLN